MTYEQKISSYKVIFYDMNGKEIEVDLPEGAYIDLDEYLYDWEQTNE